MCEIIKSPKVKYRTLNENLNEDLHGADENGSERLNLLHAPRQDIPVDLMREIIDAFGNFACNLE
jgi:hypothetical protein